MCLCVYVLQQQWVGAGLWRDVPPPPMMGRKMLPHWAKNTAIADQSVNYIVYLHRNRCIEVS